MDKFDWIWKKDPNFLYRSDEERRNSPKADCPGPDLDCDSIESDNTDESDHFSDIDDLLHSDFVSTIVGKELAYFSKFNNNINEVITYFIRGHDNDLYLIILFK